MEYLLKIIVSAFVIASVSELAKKFTPLAAILAALPLTSILAMIWLYRDTQNYQKIIELSYGIFWAILPSLLFFILFPLFLKIGIKFFWSLGLSSIFMFFIYMVYIILMKKFGVKF